MPALPDDALAGRAPQFSRPQGPPSGGSSQISQSNLLNSSGYRQGGSVYDFPSSNLSSQDGPRDTRGSFADSISSLPQNTSSNDRYHPSSSTPSNNDRYVPSSSTPSTDRYVPQSANSRCIGFRMR
eukprot:1201794-Rhodomonas_salina.2